MCIVVTGIASYGICVGINVTTHTCIVNSDWYRTVCSAPAQSGGNCVW